MRIRYLLFETLENMLKEKGGLSMIDMSKENRLIKNLEDAGCAPSTIEEFLKLSREEKRSDQYRLLSRQRASLLEEVHSSQRKIDCLDYLILSMKKEGR